MPKTRKPGWHNLAYRLPAKYQWYEWKAKTTPVLLPEGDVLICHNGDRYPSPRDTKSASEEEPRESQQLAVDFSYGDKIVNSLWPTAYDAVYVELRRGQVESTAEKNVLISQYCTTGRSAAAIEAFFLKEQLTAQAKTLASRTKSDNMICGFFKIGNLLQIMKRLGNMACTDKNKTNGVCPEGSAFRSARKHLAGPQTRHPTKDFRHGNQYGFPLMILTTLGKAGWRAGMNLYSSIYIRCINLY